MQNTAFTICRRLQEAGFQAVFAGGAVRDMILGHLPEDIDIATNARPEEIEALFEKSFAIGKHFGVILIIENGHHFEVATFRSDSGYSDGRRPDAVLFTSMEEDARRRDFTLNALFWDPVAKKLYDFVEGEKDLSQKILRFVGDPLTRIREDHLRILRAIRFKNRFQCSFHPDTQKALQENGEYIEKISGERIRTEIEKMLLHNTRKDAFLDLFSFSLLQNLFPDLFALTTTLDAFPPRTVWEHTLDCLSFLPENTPKEVAWAVLFHDIGKAKTLQKEADRNHFPGHQEVSATLFRKIARRLKFSRQEENTIAWLIANHIGFYTIPRMKRYHQLQFFDHPFFPLLIEVCRADALGHDGDASLVENIEHEYEFAHSGKLLPQFHPELLTGDDIVLLLNIPPGKKVGELKSALREAQMTGEIQTKEDAENFIKKVSQEESCS